MATRLRRLMRAPRKLTFTREGKWFVAMTIMVGFGAVNTSNNLLFLLLGMMLGLIIVSGILSEWVLQKVVVSRLASGDLYAGSEGSLHYSLENRKAFLASYGLVVVEHEERESRGRRRRALGLPEAPPKGRAEQEAEGDPGAPRALAIRVAAGTSAFATARYRFPRRGIYRFDGFDLTTRFPFGFFEKSLPVFGGHEVLVYPAMNLQLPPVGEGTETQGELVRQAEGRGGDFLGLRAYREGDDPRQIHWKVSARKNALVTRLHEREDADAVAIHLYSHLPANADAAQEAQFERTVEAAASLCAQYVKSGRQFSLHTLSGGVAEGGGPGHLLACLRHLALLEAERGEAPLTIERSRRGSRLLIAPPWTPEPVLSLFERTLEPGAAA